MEILSQSLILMGVGMGTVFSFLVLLFIVLTGAAHVTPKLSFMIPDPEPAKPAAKPAAKKDAGAEVALAILAALKRSGK